MNKIKKILYVAVIVWAIALYLMFLPALNLHSLGFWIYLLFCFVPFVLINFDYKSGPNSLKNKTYIVIGIVVAVVIMLAGSIGTPLLGGLNAYRNRISIPQSSDISDIEQFDKTQVQIIDKAVATSLADRVFGEMGADIVSQYDISDSYSSAVVNKRMYRLTPVEFSSTIKWIMTNSNGTPGYISVDVTDGETKFHEVEAGLRYMPNACLLDNLRFHLRINYPTYIFGETKFEVDDDWNPYWVSEVMSYHFIDKAPDVKGVVITNPINGECKYYDVKDIPSWVDNVYDASLICEQYNSYGRYINGIFNFSQKGETSTTDDYAYLQKDGHLWMYTGITSLGSDESNVGFIYVDMQDKDVIYIVSAGAEEYSARASAEGAVQEKRYSAVFPTMVNIDNEPVYFMGLKDNAGLIKAYAFVSYKNYQKVGVGDSVDEAYKNYTGKNAIDVNDSKEISFVVEDIAQAVVEGNSIYFIQTDKSEYYHCSIDVSNKLPFIKVGDKIKCLVKDDTIVEIK
ncbi:MAG: hypothetical protein Q4E33_03770 [Erysipelotrichaceae bacterium]|nr:hypothetical protein [Erysipelotrichaceae bacterium]